MGRSLSLLKIAALAGALALTVYGINSLNVEISRIPSNQQQTSQGYIKDTSRMNSGRKWQYVTLTYGQPFTADPDCLNGLVSKPQEVVVSLDTTVQKDVGFKQVMGQDGKLSGFSGWVIVPEDFPKTNYSGSLETKILEKGAACKAE